MPRHRSVEHDKPWFEGVRDQRDRQVAQRTGTMGTVSILGLVAVGFISGSRMVFIVTALLLVLYALVLAEALIGHILEIGTDRVVIVRWLQRNCTVHYARIVDVSEEVFKPGRGRAWAAVVTTAAERKILAVSDGYSSLDQQEIRSIVEALRSAVIAYRNRQRDVAERIAREGETSQH